MRHYSLDDFNVSNTFEGVDEINSFTPPVGCYSSRPVGCNSSRPVGCNSSRPEGVTVPGQKVLQFPANGV